MQCADRPGHLIDRSLASFFPAILGPWLQAVYADRRVIQAQFNLTELNDIVWGTCNTDPSVEECEANMAWFAEELQDACATDLKANNEVATSSLLGAFSDPSTSLSPLTPHPSNRSTNLHSSTRSSMPRLEHHRRVLLRLRVLVRGASGGRVLLHAPARDGPPKLERPELLRVHAADHVRVRQPGPEHERLAGDIRGRGGHHEQGLRLGVRAGDGGAEQRGGREGSPVVRGARRRSPRRTGRCWRRRGMVVAVVVGQRANPSDDTDGHLTIFRLHAHPSTGSADPRTFSLVLRATRRTRC